MLSRLSSHFRHNVVGYLALFFALSGTAFAAANAALKAGDAAGGDLAGTYPNPTIAAGAVTGGNSGKVADNSLTGDDVQNDSLKGADVDESSLGKVGDANTLDGLDSTALGAGAIMGEADCGLCSNPGPRTYFIAPSGRSELGSDLDKATQLSPNAVLKAGDLAVRVGAGWTEGTGAQVKVTLQFEANTLTSVSCTIVLDEGFQTCNSGNANVTVPAGTAMRLKVETNAGVNQLTEVLFGWRLVGPL